MSKRHYNGAMFRLTREVRFAVNSTPQSLSVKPTNSYGGFPTLRGFGAWMSLQVTVAGPLDAASSYLVNIKQIDAVVRERVIPLVSDAARLGTGRATPEQTVLQALQLLQSSWPALSTEAVVLNLSPFLSISSRALELPMVRLSQKFEFSATHRLHNPSLSEAENCRVYGKCNNPHGHGHNYEVQVTLRGKPDDSGVLVDVPQFERIVAGIVIERFDHKNLNVELPEFRELIPTVENIAMTIYRLLKPKFADSRSQLASVTVWETPKTWCEFSEDP
jgi:6-pyruvoyltetrahydropterin/6-carboxytetrahydropterin synthase